MAFAIGWCGGSFVKPFFTKDAAGLGRIDAMALRCAGREPLPRESWAHHHPPGGRRHYFHRSAAFHKIIIGRF
jgi:hypothetical protein